VRFNSGFKGLRKQIPTKLWYSLLGYTLDKPGNHNLNKKSTKHMIFAAEI